MKVDASKRKDFVSKDRFSGEKRSLETDMVKITTLYWRGKKQVKIIGSRLGSVRSPHVIFT